MCNDVLNLFHGLEFLLGLVIVLNEAGHLLLHPVRELDILSLLLLLLLPLSCLFPVVAGFAVTHPDSTQQVQIQHLGLCCCRKSHYLGLKISYTPNKQTETVLCKHDLTKDRYPYPWE